MRIALEAVLVVFAASHGAVRERESTRTLARRRTVGVSHAMGFFPSEQHATHERRNRRFAGLVRTVYHIEPSLERANLVILERAEPPDVNMFHEPAHSDSFSSRSMTSVSATSLKSEILRGSDAGTAMPRFTNSLWM